MKQAKKENFINDHDLKSMSAKQLRDLAYNNPPKESASELQTNLREEFLSNITSWGSLGTFINNDNYEEIDGAIAPDNARKLLAFGLNQEQVGKPEAIAAIILARELDPDDVRFLADSIKKSSTDFTVQDLIDSAARKHSGKKDEAIFFKNLYAQANGNFNCVTKVMISSDNDYWSPKRIENRIEDNHRSIDKVAELDICDGHYTFENNNDLTLLEEIMKNQDSINDRVIDNIADLEADPDINYIHTRSFQFLFQYPETKEFVHTLIEGSNNNKGDGSLAHSLVQHAASNGYPELVDTYTQSFNKNDEVSDSVLAELSKNGYTEAAKTIIKKGKINKSDALEELLFEDLNAFLVLADEITLTDEKVRSLYTKVVTRFSGGRRHLEALRRCGFAPTQHAAEAYRTLVNDPPPAAMMLDWFENYLDKPQKGAARL